MAVTRDLAVGLGTDRPRSGPFLVADNELPLFEGRGGNSAESIS